ncbi:MAG: NfeD family protein [Halobacteria archaeon]|nr:NfeD family protein [Halobacteria archaeon]
MAVLSIAGVPLSLPFILAIVGLVLVVGEALAPGAHLMVVGSALLGAGLTGMLFNIDSYLYLTVFVLLYGGVTFYFYGTLLDRLTGEGEATTDSSQLMGKTGRVTERVTETSGQVKLEEGFNPYYTARSAEGEIPEGEKVRVVNPRGGNVLVVEPLEKQEGNGD